MLLEGWRLGKEYTEKTDKLKNRLRVTAISHMDHAQNDVFCENTQNSYKEKKNETS